MIGRRGYGKTTFALRLLKEAYKRGRRREMLAFAPNGLPAVVRNKVRLLSNLQEIAQISQAAVLIDDASAYLRGVVADSDIRSLVVGARHRETDIVFVYHNIAQTPPFLFSLADTIVFFSVTDSKEAIKQKLGFEPALYRTALMAISLPKYKWLAYNLNTHNAIGGML